MCLYKTCRYILLFVLVILVSETVIAKPAISSEVFGKFIPKKKIKIYTLTNDSGMEAKLIPFGATLVSLKVPDANGNFADVLLGYNRLVEYVRDKFYLGCIIGNTGSDKQLYRAGVFKNKYSCGITFSRTISDGGNKLNVKVKYTLTNDNELKIEYEAKTNKKTIVNLTNHSYFNLAGQGVGNILNHNIMINADYYIPEVNGIPTGEIRKVEGTVFDFRKPLTIGNFGHNYILNKKSPGELSLAARVQEPACGRVLEVFTTEPVMLFDSCDFGKGIRGKWGNVYKKDSGFCLEAGHYPDSFGKSAVLKRGELYKQTTIYKFSVQH